MKTLKLADISASDIRSIASVREKGGTVYDWTQPDGVVLSADEKRQVGDITSRLFSYRTSLMNEATIWARAIYPLLVLAEADDIQAWAQVPLRACYPHVELQGIADGILGSGITGVVEVPYLVVVEAKRGLEGQDPRFQVQGQMLAAVRLNYEYDQQPVQEMFGCYTISDSWTFIRATVQDVDTERPEMTLETSREYVQKVEAETILSLLKHIAARGQEHHSREVVA
jgi:hypothetical protein